MLRKQFLLQLTSAFMGIQSLHTLQQLNNHLPDQDTLMPVLFIGHGSPMNGIENNVFSEGWKQMAASIATPKAVIVVSAHWLTKGTQITAMDKPRTIHDFGGFPKALYEVQYPAPGNPTLAAATADQVTSTHITMNHDWGLDHGAWTIIRHMYPQANIPVLQLSIDYTKSAKEHYQIAKELFALRKKGVLMIGSGNMVHNLGMVAWHKLNEPEYGFDWALHMNEQFKQLIAQGHHQPLIEYEKLGSAARLAIPTPEHYLPLIYTLGLQAKHENISFFNDKAVGGSLTMTSVKIGG